MIQSTSFRAGFFSCIPRRLIVLYRKELEQGGSIFGLSYRNGSLKDDVGIGNKTYIKP